MCLSPLYVQNPLYSKEGIYANYVKEVYGKPITYIVVPCGVCADCIAMKQSDIVQRVQMELRDKWCYMVTLTYNKDSVPWLEFSNGERHMYCDFDDIRLMIKRLRKFYPDIFDCDFRYLFVSEYGGKRHRPHYHGLLFFSKKGDKIDSLNLEHELFRIVKGEWRRNYGTCLKPLYKPLFTYKRYRQYRNYDLHQVLYDRGSDESSVAYYVTKYLLKYDDYVEKMLRYYHEVLPEEEFNDKIIYFTPRRSASHSFGVNDYSKKYIRECIEKSIDQGKPFPLYVNPDNGSVQPLGRYFRKVFMTLEDLRKFSKNPGFDEYQDRTRDYYEFDYKTSRLNQRRRLVLQNSADYDEFD